MSAAARVVDAIGAAQSALYEAEQSLNDATTKLRAAKKARESARTNTPPKKLLELRTAHELAEEVHAAAIRERDAAAQSVRDTNAALPRADAADRWKAADDALAPCKLIAREVIKLQDQITALEADLARPFRAYLECTDLIGTQANPMTEHEPGRPRFVTDLIREVRRDLGQDVPDIATTTPQGKLLAHTTAAANARAQQDMARVPRPTFLAELNPTQRDQLLWVLHARGIATASDLELTRGLSQAQLYALADAPLAGKPVDVSKIQPNTLAQIANGLPRALRICAVPPIGTSGNVAGGPGKPYSPEAVQQLRNTQRGWPASPGAAAPKPDDRWASRNHEVVAAEAEFHARVGQFHTQRLVTEPATEKADK